METTIRATIDGFVATIELRQPPANYFDLASIRGITDAAAAVCGEGARAIVLCSQGKHFCAGADFSSGDMAENRQEAARTLYTAALGLFEIPVPVIAAVQGSSVGGGLGLACAADFRVASPESRFHANFAALGFHHGFALTVTLPALVGSQRAADLLYTGRRLGGEQAFGIGLVDRLVADGEERVEAARWAAEIAASAPLAVRSMKQTLRGPVAERARAALERELSEQAWLWQTKDSEAGIAANLARATPVFTGT